MKNTIAKKLIISLSLLVMFFSLFSPVMIVRAESNSTATTSSLSLQEFATSLQKPNSTILAGVYVDNVMAVPVVQQPSGMPAYVSTNAGTVTQFGFATKYGSIGLLAHNYLAGASFSQLQAGTVISLVYGDGSVKYYQVNIVKQYQALDPTNAYSNFVDLSNPGKTLTSTDVFLQTYGLGNVLVLQTCIYANGNSSWGRLFVIAVPYDNVTAKTVRNITAQEVAYLNK